MRRLALTFPFILVLMARSLSAQVPQSERDALIAIYNSTGGASWTNHAGWLGAPGTECTWTQVYCEQGHVVGVYLSENNLVGTLPSQLGDLTAVQELFFSANTNLSGPIPSSVANLASLEKFWANNNKLSGTLAPIASLPKLRELVLSANKLTGAPVVPASPDLDRLELNDNLLTGPIPASITSRTKLRTIRLEYNTLNGSIPSDIGNLTQLEVFSASVNQFTGPIPQSIGSLTKLRALGLAENQLTGQIPEGLSNLVELQELYFSENQLTGPIPSGIGNLTKLEQLWLNNNQLSGDIPAGIGALVNAERIYLSANRLTGMIPTGLSNATKLTDLVLDNNSLEGTIPPLGNLKQLTALVLYNNRLTGSIPSDIVTLPKLKLVFLSNNELTGPIPAGMSQLSSLEMLLLNGNLLTGTLPSEIGTLSNLVYLHLAANQLSGAIPPSWFLLPNLLELSLGSNLLSGSIPSEVASATKLEYLNLGSNQFRGTVPAGIVNLTNTYYLDLGRNALVAPNQTVLDFLQAKSSNDFLHSQTVPPLNVGVDAVSAFTVSLSWKTIDYNFDPGGYQILASTTPGGPYVPLLTTPSKYNSDAIVTGLSASTKYYFVVKSITFPHGGGVYYQLNTIFSDASAEVSATTSAATPSPANVIVTSYPQGMGQTPGQSGGTDSYMLTNIGGTATSIALTQSGTFFTQAPGAFTLQPGANQIVTLTGTAQPAGDYAGASIPTGSGIEQGLQIGVRLLVANAQQGTVSISALSSRVDLVAPQGVNPSGSVSFRNDGSSTFTGVLVSDVEFIVPQAGLISIPAGGSASRSVTSNRAKRPDAALLSGTQAGRVSLISIPGAGSSSRSPFGGSTSVSLVSVVDTVQPPTSSGSIPPLGAGEVALFLPAVSHASGSEGNVLCDLSILNAYGAGPIPDLRLFYTAIGGGSSAVANLASVGAGQSLGLADVVKSVFEGDAEQGTLQIRSTKTANLSATANSINEGNPIGHFGTSIPLFRSDRSASSSRPLLITGVRKDSSGHTSLYLQETSGAAASTSLEFLNAAGSVVGTQHVNVVPFGAAALPDALVEGTVAVRVVVQSGNVVAYATPFDAASGDRWAVTDWSLLYAYDPAEAVVIPIGGSVRGANESYFRTDLAITNRCDSLAKRPGDAGYDPLDPCTSATAAGLLQFHSTDGRIIEKSVALGLLGSVAFNDVLRSAFDLQDDAIGHITFTPSSGAFALTSRTYASIAGSSSAFGSSVPALGTSLALRPGQSRRIGGLSDSTRRTIQARTAATSRTNFGLVEVSGAPAKVRVSVFYNDPRSLAAGKPLAVKEYELAPNELVSRSFLVEEILGAARETLYGDLTDVQVLFEVVSTTGSVVIYTSSIDNGTNDAVIRVE